MYRSLLVPLDGSESAEQALPMALSIARRAGAKLELASVQVPFPAVHGEDMARLDNPLEAEARDKARAYLDGAAQRITAASTVPVTTTLLAGMAADSLYNHATTTGTDLVVMTVVGTGPWTRLWLGSVADELVRRLPMPLLLLRPRQPAPELSVEPPVQRILVPLDGSVVAEQIIEPVANLGILTRAKFTLLRVVTFAGAGGESSRRPPQVEEQLRAEAQSYLDRVAERLRARTLPVETRVVVHEHPAVAILDAHSREIDLVAFTTRGNRALPWLFLGSTADKLLRGASTPVLVQRPRDSSPA